MQGKSSRVDTKIECGNRSLAGITPIEWANTHNGAQPNYLIMIDRLGQASFLG